VAQFPRGRQLLLWAFWPVRNYEYSLIDDRHLVWHLEFAFAISLPTVPAKNQHQRQLKQRKKNIEQLQQGSCSAFPHTPSKQKKPGKRKSIIEKKYLQAKIQNYGISIYLPRTG